MVQKVTVIKAVTNSIEDLLLQDIFDILIPFSLLTVACMVIRRLVFAQTGWPIRGRNLIRICVFDCNFPLRLLLSWSWCSWNIVPYSLMSLVFIPRKQREKREGEKRRKKERKKREKKRSDQWFRTHNFLLNILWTLTWPTLILFLRVAPEDRSKLWEEKVEPRESIEQNDKWQG